MEDVELSKIINIIIFSVACDPTMRVKGRWLYFVTEIFDIKKRELIYILTVNTTKGNYDQH